VGHYLRKKGVALSNLTIMCQEFRALQILGCDTSNSGSVIVANYGQHME
jgi:hypothetical protein